MRIRSLRSTRAMGVYPRAQLPRTADVSIEARIGEKIQPQPNGCWLFKGRADRYGHSRAAGGGWVAVHRFVYETLVGPIPEGHHLHHHCKTLGCCNPAHLVPLTFPEHMAEHRRMADAS